MLMQIQDSFFLQSIIGCVALLLIVGAGQLTNKIVFMAKIDIKDLGFAVFIVCAFLFLLTLLVLTLKGLGWSVMAVATFSPETPEFHRGLVSLLFGTFLIGFGAYAEATSKRINRNRENAHEAQ